MCCHYPMMNPIILSPNIASSEMSFSHMTVDLEDYKVELDGYVSKGLQRSMDRNERLEKLAPISCSNATLYLYWNPNKDTDFSKYILQSLTVALENGDWKDVLVATIKLDGGVEIDEKQWLGILDPLINLEKLIVEFRPTFVDDEDDDYDPKADVYDYTFDNRITLLNTLMHSVANDEITCPRLQELEFRGAEFNTSGHVHSKENMLECLQNRNYMRIPLDILTILDAKYFKLEDIENLKMYVGEINWDGKRFCEYPENCEINSDDDLDDISVSASELDEDSDFVIGWVEEYVA